MGAEGDGVIELDGAHVLETEDGVGIEPRWPGAVGHSGLRWGFGEPRIEAGREAAEEPVGCLPGPNLGEAELRDEAILHRAEEALDTALGLGTRRGDPFNAQLVQDAPDLRERALAAELLRHGLRPVGIAVEDAVAVGVGREGKADPPDHLLEDLQIAVGGLLVVEPGPEELPGRIVEGGMEH